MRFSKRTGDLIDSFIMKLIAVSKEEGMISFATGLPDKRLFDTEGIARAAADLFEDIERARDALQYGTIKGISPLRKKIAARCRKEMSVNVSEENIFIINGSQECFDLIGKMFIDRGDGMVMDDPGYLGALQAFSLYGPEFIGVKLNENGPDAEGLKKALQRNPKLYYSIPNHQNPSGFSYSLDKRKEVAELISSSDAVMVEDDAYGELGYDGRIGPPVRSMADNVILTGSYSKIISPGMRIGWMIVPDEMVEMTMKCVESSSLHANTFSQNVMDRYLEQNDLDSYLCTLRKEYKRKSRLMLDLLDDHLPPELEWNTPNGGMFIWLRTPNGTDAMRFYESALRRKLVVMPGRPFHINGGVNTIRLNFATAGDEEIKEGVSRLAKAYDGLF
ncbi:MAG: PLP-dependent aminotransferase family protein [Methanomassiliicoccaceae archaeon]|jgi:2-aminoadipate transaminase|nr:PLP-dependent aminotransferase family protein [Methanomassiliicoccaceae archaeon]